MSGSVSEPVPRDVSEPSAGRRRTVPGTVPPRSVGDTSTFGAAVIVPHAACAPAAPAHMTNATTAQIARNPIPPTAKSPGFIPGAQVAQKP